MSTVHATSKLYKESMSQGVVVIIGVPFCRWTDRLMTWNTSLLVKTRQYMR